MEFELKRKERIRLAGVRHSIQSVTGAFNKLQNGYHRESMGSDENGIPCRVPAGEQLKVFALVIYVPSRWDVSWTTFGGNWRQVAIPTRT